MFNTEIINKYKSKLQDAVSGTTMFYAWAYNNGPDIGMRKYGDEQHRVQDVIIDDICWLIAGDVYMVANGAAMRLNSCFKVESVPVENLVVELRAQGMVDGEIDQIPLGLFCVAERTVVSDEFGLLRLK